MIGFVYMWINNINGKKYIGLHEGSEDDNYIGSGVYFKRAIKKYGIENFNRIILYKEYESSLNLYKKEMEIINEFNAVFSSDFYNLTNYDPKQINQVKMKGQRIITKETRENMSKAAIQNAIDNPWTDERRQKHIKSHIGINFKKKEGSGTGNKNSMYGKKWYTNGIDSKVFKEGQQPDRWNPGRIQLNLMGDNNPSRRDDVREKLKIAANNPNRKGTIIYELIDPLGNVHIVNGHINRWFLDFGTTYAIAKNPINGWTINKIGVIE